jgi:signal transduction histidine kinase
MPRVAESEEFLDALTAVNLRRIWILTLVGAALAVGVWVAERLVGAAANALHVVTDDLVTSAIAIVVVWFVRRRPRRGLWPRLFVVAYVIVWLVSLDGYFFVVFSLGTHNASYAIGVTGAAVFFVLAPRWLLPILAVNHAYYCARLLAVTHVTLQLAPPLIDGTVCVAVSALGSWFLYHAARENFLKTRALASTNAELREVMAIAAHDLRSPLLGLRDLLGLARREPAAEGGKLARVLDLATESCTAMVRLVSRLVDSHAAEEAIDRLQLRPHDLREACAAAAARQQIVADAKRQHLVVTVPPQPLVARIDPATLAQVIDNLLGNALKFSAAEATVELALVADGSMARIEVRDTGPGVPADERDRLFQKFSRGSARPTGNESSTGLGLHIVKTLTEAMDGKATHTPRVPTGSIFGVEFALSR